MDFFNDTPSAAEQIAAKYAQYPVPRWRRFFSDISEQLDEIHARPTKTVKTTHEPVSVNVATEYPAMEAQQAKLSSPSLDFAVEAKKINIAAQNVKQVTIGYYLVDLGMSNSMQLVLIKFRTHVFYQSIRCSRTKQILDDQTKQTRYR